VKHLVNGRSIAFDDNAKMSEKLQPEAFSASSSHLLKIARKHARDIQRVSCSLRKFLVAQDYPQTI